MYERLGREQADVVDRRLDHLEGRIIEERLVLSGGEITATAHQSPRAGDRSLCTSSPASPSNVFEQADLATGFDDAGQFGPDRIPIVDRTKRQADHRSVDRAPRQRECLADPGHQLDGTIDVERSLARTSTHEPIRFDGDDRRDTGLAGEVWKARPGASTEIEHASLDVADEIDTEPFEEQTVGKPHDRIVDDSVEPTMQSTDHTIGHRQGHPRR